MTTQEIVTIVLYAVVGLISLVSGIVNYVRTGKFRNEVRFTTLQALRSTETSTETPTETSTETPTETERYNVEQSIISIYEDIQRVVDNVESIRSQLNKKE